MYAKRERSPTEQYRSGLHYAAEFYEGGHVIMYMLKQVEAKYGIDALRFDRNIGN